MEFGQACPLIFALRSILDPIPPLLHGFRGSYRREPCSLRYFLVTADCYCKPIVTRVGLAMAAFCLGDHFEIVAHHQNLHQNRTPLGSSSTSLRDPSRRESPRTHS